MTDGLKVFFGPIQQVNTLTDANNDGSFDFIDGSNIIYFGTGTPYVIVGLEGWEGRPAIDTSQIMRPQRHGAWATEMLSQPRVITLTLEVVTADKFAILPGSNNTIYRQSLIDHMAITTKEYILGVDMGWNKSVEFVFGRVTDFRMNTQTFYHKHQTALIEFTATDPRKFLGDPTGLTSAVQKSISSYLDSSAGTGVTSNYPYNYSFLYGGFPATILARNYFTNPAFAPDPSGVKAAIRRNFFYNPSVSVDTNSFATLAGTGSLSRTNIITNPSFERGTAASVVRTNLMVNPSFEASAAASAARINLATDPNSNRGDTTQFGFDYGGTGAGSAAYVNAAGAIGNGYIRQTWTTASSTGQCGTYGNQFGAISNQAYTWSAYVRSSVAQTMTLGVDWRNSSGTIIGNSRATTFSVPANVWTRVYQTATSPAGTANGTVTYFGAATGAVIWPAGATLDVDNTLVEAVSTLGAYFDGGTGVTGEWNHIWTGTANASTSYEQQNTVANLTPGNVFAYQSISWSNSRTYSMRLYANSTSNDTYASPGGDTGGMRLGMIAGQTYTVSATFRMNAPQTGTLNSRARTLMLFWRDSTGTYNSVSSSQAINDLTQQRLSVTGTIPVGATEAFIRFYNGASSGGGDVWWDDSMLEKVSALGPYFDGNSASTPDFTYAWTATSDASTSTLSAALVGDAVASPYSMVTQATSWTGSRAKSLRITPNDPSNDSYVDIKNMVWALPTSTAMVFSGTLRVPATLTGTLHSSALKPRISMGGSDLPLNFVQTATNALGTYRVIAKFTTTSAAFDFFRLYNGASMGNGDVFWDDIVVETAPSDGTYFDGSLASGSDFTYSWSGTADSSTSTKAIPQGRFSDASNPVSQNVYRSAWIFGTTDLSGSVRMYVRGFSSAPNFVQIQHTYSVYVRSSYNTFVKPQVDWYNGSTLVSSDTSGAAFQLIAGQWTRIYMMSTPTTTTTQNSIFTVATDPLSGVAIPTGGKIDVTGILVEQSPIVDSFFDGNTNDTATEIYAWTGTNGASESTLSASPVYGMTGVGVATPYYDFGTVKGMTLTPNTSSNDSKATYTVDPAKLSDLSGKTVGISAIARINRLLTGVLSTNALKVGMVVTSTVGGTNTYWSSALDNVTPITGSVREQRLSVNVSIPIDVTAISLVFMNGAASGGGSVHWDKGILSIGPYADYFDGYNTSNPKYSVYWEGSPNQSTSVIMQPTIGQNVASFTVSGNTDARVLYTITGTILNPTIKVTDSKGTRSITFNMSLTNQMGSIVLDPFNGFATLNGSNAMYTITGRSPYDFELAPGPVVVEFTGTNFTYASMAINWLSATI